MKTLSKQVIMSYAALLVSDALMTVLYMVIYNQLLIEIFNNLNSINIIQAYILFYLTRLLFNRDKLHFTIEEEIFDSFKRNLLKFIHYTIWGIFIKLIVYFTI